MNKKTFPALLKHLYQILEFIQDFCLEQGLNHNLASKVVLAAEEAIVNIINHGYPTGQGDIEIICEILEKKPAIKVSIRDEGIPFNPIPKAREIKKQKESSPLSLNSPVGGYGIFLYIQMMDQVEYKRTNKGNNLTLIKYI